MDKEKRKVLVVLIVCITIIALAILGFNTDIEYEKADGTSLKVKSINSYSFENVNEQEVLTDTIE